MRALWSGSISFGLVNIPVRLYSGLDQREDLQLRMLHAKDLSPIRYAKVCLKDGTEVANDQIVKGYEFADGDFIVLTDEDFQKADPEKTKTIVIEEFVGEAEIDVRYYEKPYYLEPQKGAGHAYALLREALERSQRVAIGRFVLHNRENLGILKPVGRVITLTQIRFPAELRAPDQLDLPDKSESSAREVELALRLIEQLTGDFKPEMFHDTYTDELKELISEKAMGRKPKSRREAASGTRVSDLMEALQASLKTPGGVKHGPRKVPQKTPS